MLKGALTGLLGVSKGQSAEVQNFVALLMNNAFVRVDYYAYSCSISAEKWGVEKLNCGVCYVTDVAILYPKDLTPSEKTFFHHASSQCRKRQ